MAILRNALHCIRNFSQSGKRYSNTSGSSPKKKAKISVLNEHFSIGFATTAKIGAKVATQISSNYSESVPLVDGKALFRRKSINVA